MVDSAAISIRAATAADAAQLFGLEQELFGSDAWTRNQVDDELRRIGDTRWYAVAFTGGQLVGYVGLYLSPPDADVQTIAVAPDLQGRGIGRRLLDAAIEFAWAQECTRLFLEVRADNEAALALYGRTGFVRLGRRSRYYADGVDAVNMRLRRHEVAPLLGGQPDG